MMIAVNKSQTKRPKTVWFIEGVYYTSKGKLINPATHYICTRNKMAKVHREHKLKWGKVATKK